MVDFDVVDLPPVDHVAAGDTAPDFTRPLVNEEYWEDASLADLTAERLPSETPRRLLILL